MVTFWFICFILFLIIEIITVNLVTIWFAIGALGALVISLLIDSELISIITFLVVSIISLLLTRPFLKKWHDKKIIPTNLDVVIGKIGIVTQDILINNPGEVKIYGKTWTAVSEHEILKNKKVEVLNIEGNKLIVKALKEES